MRKNKEMILSSPPKVESLAMPLLGCYNPGLMGGGGIMITTDNEI